jgi:hypothetical protein
LCLGSCGREADDDASEETETGNEYCADTEDFEIENDPACPESAPTLLKVCDEPPALTCTYVDCQGNGVASFFCSDGAWSASFVDCC